MYSPILGRFLQVDPIGYEDQMILYAYVGNDPMNGVDPTGMYECGDPDGKTCKAVAAAAAEIKAARNYYASRKIGSRLTNGSKKAVEQLDKALDALGSENDGNGLKVELGSLPGANGQFETPADRPVSAGGGRNGTITLDPQLGWGTTPGGTLAHEAQHARNYNDGHYRAAGRMVEEFHGSATGFLVLAQQGVRTDWKEYIFSRMRAYTGLGGRMAEREAINFLKTRGIEINIYVP